MEIIFFQGGGGGGGGGGWIGGWGQKSIKVSAEKKVKWLSALKSSNVK